MNSYIKQILEEKDVVARDKKTQKIINYLINTYIKKYNKSPVNIEKEALKDIQEIVDYFKSTKINLRGNKDILLRITSLEGETDFIKWLLKDAVCKSTPDLHIQLSSPLRFACLNDHTELVEFYLTDKELKRSNMNEVNGGALHTVISQQNMTLVKLFMEQPEIDIQIEHIRSIFKWDYIKQQEILKYISKSKVKEKFLQRMLQYKNEMLEYIKELITDYEFVFTEEMKNNMRYNKEIKDLLYKKNFVYQLEKKLPTKQNRGTICKI